MEIGEKLQALREQRGWSQQELANKSGVIRPSISQIENNRVKHPSGDKLFKLAKAFEMSPEEFYTAIGYQEPVTSDKSEVVKELEAIGNELRDCERHLYQVIAKIRTSKLS